MKNKILILIIMVLGVVLVHSCAMTTTTREEENKVVNEITNIVVEYGSLSIVDFENAVKVATKKVENAVVGVALKNVSQVSSGATSLDNIATGSGVIYKAKENYENNVLTSYTYYVVTNKHVILDTNVKQTKVYVYLGYEDVEVEAQILGYDAKMDIACLSFEHTTYIQPVEFGDSDKLEKSSFVIAIGNPEGYDYFGSATFGIVSSPLRYLSSDTDGDGVQDFNSPYIQHDASINPGNSGGGLFDIEGKLVGINTLKIVEEKVENMGFAIPSNDVLYLLENYLEKGETLIRPRLGIMGIEARVLTPAVIEAQGLKSLPDIYKTNEIPYGIYVTEIMSKGSIYGSGVKADDIILEFDGIKLKDMNTFSAIINTASKYHVGDKVEIKYYSRTTNNIETTYITLKSV